MAVYNIALSLVVTNSQLKQEKTRTFCSRWVIVVMANTKGTSETYGPDRPFGD